MKKTDEETNEAMLRAVMVAVCFLAFCLCLVVGWSL